VKDKIPDTTRKNIAITNKFIDAFAEISEPEAQVVQSKKSKSKVPLRDPFKTLPINLCHRILLALDPLQVAGVSRVSRTWYQVTMEQDLIWRYFVDQDFPSAKEHIHSVDEEKRSIWTNNLSKISPWKILYFQQFDNELKKQEEAQQDEDWNLRNIMSKKMGCHHAWKCISFAKVLTGSDPALEAQGFEMYSFACNKCNRAKTCYIRKSDWESINVTFQTVGRSRWVVDYWDFDHEGAMAKAKLRRSYATEEEED